MKTEDEQLFDRLLTSKGGLYTPDSQAEKDFLHEILKVLRLSVDEYTLPALKKPLATKIVLNFSNTNDIEANCGAPGGQYFINISIGTVKVLRFIFNHMFTSPHFMAMVGNRELESRMADKLPAFDYISFSEIMRDWDGKSFPYPKCPTRRLLAEFLLYQSLTYIVLHELGHIVNGHLDYLIHKSLSKEIVDKTEGEIEQANLDRQTFEFDADTFAITELYNFGVEALKDYRIIQPQRHDKFYESDFYNLKFLSLAVFGKFKLFEHEKISPDYLLQVVHPPAILRQRFLMKSMMNAVNVPELEKLLIFAVGDGIKHAERGFEYMTTSPPKTILEVDHLYDHHWNNIIDNWPRAKELLAPYAYIDLRNYTRKT